MSKLTTYWESYDRFYDDFQKEGLNLDDLLLKNKFAFNNGKLTFSSKSKFNFGTKVAASHEHSLKAKVFKGTLDFNVKNGEFTVESEQDHHQKDHIQVGSYLKSVTSHSAEACNSDANLQIRVHHKDNLLVSLGLENGSICKGLAPHVVSLGTSYSTPVDDKRVTFNTLFKLNVDSKHLSLISFLLKAKNAKTTGFFLANINKIEGEDKKSNQEIDLSFKFVHAVSDKTKIGGSLNHDINTKKSEATFVASHKFDNVRVNAKLDSQRALSLGITSVRDDLTLGFTAKSELKSATEKSGETTTKKHWFNHKFGVSAEFNRL